MSAGDWIKLAGVIGTLIAAVYAAFRVGRSSDRASRASLQGAQQQSTAAASAAENSGYTRAQDIIDAAVATQKQVFDDALSGMRERMAEMKERLDEHSKTIQQQTQELRDQHKQIEILEQGRREDRRLYRTYVERLLSLLRSNGISYPEPPPFFDNEPNVP